MSRRFLALPLLVVMGCGTSEHASPKKGAPDGEAPMRSHVGSTRGSAVVLSRDERVAVVSNRSAGVVTVFHLDPTKPLDQLIAGHAEIDMDAAPGRDPTGPGSEPWAAVIGADDDTAYVISRYDQTVSRIVGLHGSPQLDVSVDVGSEPTAIAIQPSGNWVFVANWGEGTISVVSVHDDELRITATLDLNAALAQSGLIGVTESRPALAHPRALAIADDGDDDDADETLYATEFFSMPKEPMSDPTSPASRSSSIAVGRGSSIPFPSARGRCSTLLRSRRSSIPGSRIPTAPRPGASRTSCTPLPLTAASSS